MDAAIKVNIPTISPQTAIPCLNIMRGVVNRAITELEHDIETPKVVKNEAALQCPNKITLKWLWENVPYRFWFILIGLLISAFTLGTTFANTKMYSSLIDLLTANNNTSNTETEKHK